MAHIKTHHFAHVHKKGTISLMLHKKRTILLMPIKKGTISLMPHIKRYHLAHDFNIRTKSSKKVGKAPFC